MWDFPDQDQPMSPVLEVRFFTTEPPGALGIPFIQAPEPQIGYNLPKMPWQNWDSNTLSLVKSPNCFGSA